MENLATNAKITWCPGCPNSAILVAFRKLVEELRNEGRLKLENLVAVGGIGCHGKITDYLNINTFTSLHGRLLPTMQGIKIANPNLQVVGFSGDGDSYSEGAEHLIHAAKRNSDVNLFIHDNQVFALTTGQATATSPKGFKGKSTPSGSIEEPFNPLLLMLASGATFVARTYAGDIEGTKKIMRQAIEHKGFSFMDIIQPCITFYDTRDFYKDHTYWIDKKYPSQKLETAIKKVTAQEEKIALGVFYKVEKPTFEESLYA
ncbi:MAG: thiamine pyrophosphate-dependent enzyme [Candidatus Wolfebacteria bacterium]|nr:thiamine pyrophosphate-dependent enzyme [Candidatus Wolfebacteria bacterium]